MLLPIWVNDLQCGDVPLRKSVVVFELEALTRHGDGRPHRMDMLDV